MAITLDVSSTFPDDTAVGAYTIETQPSDTRSAPSGSPVATATVSAGSVTFSGLTEDQSYFAIGQVSGEWRRYGFTVNQVAEAQFVSRTELAGYATDEELAGVSTRVDGIETIDAQNTGNIFDLDTRVKGHTLDLAALVERISALENKTQDVGGPIHDFKLGAISEQDGTATTITPALPTGLEDGDVMIALIFCRQSGRAFTWPAGWTAFYSQSSTSAGSLSLARRAWASGDTAPGIGVDSTTNYTTIAQVISAKNIDSNPLATTGTYTDRSSGTQDIAAAGITTKFDGSLILAIGNAAQDFTTEPAVTSGDGLTWHRAGYKASTQGTDATLVWDYAVAPFDERPVIADKTFSSAGVDTLGSRGVVLEIAANPRPATPTVLKEDLADGTTLPLVGMVMGGSTVADISAELTATNAHGLIPFKYARLGVPITATASEVETLVNTYRDRGIVPLVCAGFPNRIPSQAEAESMGDWAAALEGKILAIEFGNETNFSYQSASWQQGANYATRVKQAHDAIDGRVKLIVQGKGNNTDWMTQMQGSVANIGDYAEGWAAHRYQTDYDAYIDEYATEISGFAHPEIWVTEMGWSSRNGTAVSDAYGWPTTMTYQDVANNLQTFYDTVKSKVKAIFLYHIHDFTTVGANNSRENFFGALSYDTAWGDWKDKPYISDKVRTLLRAEALSDPTVWQGVSDAFSQGGWSSADTQITRRSDLPDTAHVPIGQGSALTHYRRLSRFAGKLNGTHNLAALPFGLISLKRGVSEWPASGTVLIDGKQITYTSRGFNDQAQVGYLAGCSASTGSYPDGTWVELQSLYDAGADNDNVRTQLLRDSTVDGQTFYRFDSGMKRRLYLSVRCADPNPIVGDSEPQIWQIKQKPDGKMPPILSFVEGLDYFVLRQNVSRNPVELARFDSGDGLDKSVWTRWCFEIKFDSDPTVGYVQAFADLDNSGTLTDLTGKLYCQTAYAEGNVEGVGTRACLSIGPYSSAYATPDGAPGIYRDYSGIQVVDNG